MHSARSRRRSSCAGFRNVPEAAGAVRLVIVDARKSLNLAMTAAPVRSHWGGAATTTTSPIDFSMLPGAAIRES